MWSNWQPTWKTFEVVCWLESWLESTLIPDANGDAIRWVFICEAAKTCLRYFRVDIFSHIVVKNQTHHLVKNIMSFLKNGESPNFTKKGNGERFRSFTHLSVFHNFGPKKPTDRHPVVSPVTSPPQRNPPFVQFASAFFCERSQAPKISDIFIFICVFFLGCGSKITILRWVFIELFQVPNKMQLVYHSYVYPMEKNPLLA